MSNVPLDHQRNEQPANDAGYTALMAVKPGERLREARNARKLDLEAAAEQMNLSVSVLRALENDDYKSLPGSTFIKGYIRSYARMLRLPPDDLVRAFEYQTGVHSSMDEQHPLPDKPAKKNFPLIRTLLVLLLLAGVAWLFLSGEDKASTGSVPQQTAPEAVPGTGAATDSASQQLITPPVIESRAQLPATEPPESGATESVAIDAVQQELTTSTRPPIDKDVDVQDIAGPENAVVAAASENTSAEEPVTSAPTEPAVQDSAGRLRMEFIEDCWVEIRNKQEELIYANLLRSGAVYEKTLPEPFEVKLGNGNAARLSYNGDPVDFTPSKRTSVARLSFGQ